MDTVTIVVALTVLAVVALAASWILGRHPEEASDHEFTEPDGSGPTGTPYPPGSRPAGPGAEDMNPHDHDR